MPIQSARTIPTVRRETADTFETYDAMQQTPVAAPGDDISFDELLAPVDADDDLGGIDFDDPTVAGDFEFTVDPPASGDGDFGVIPPEQTVLINLLDAYLTLVPQPTRAQTDALSASLGMSVPEDVALLHELLEQVHAETEATTGVSETEISLAGAMHDNGISDRISATLAQAGIVDDEDQSDVIDPHVDDSTATNPVFLEDDGEDDGDGTVEEDDEDRDFDGDADFNGDADLDVPALSADDLAQLAQDLHAADNNGNNIPDAVEADTTSAPGVNPGVDDDFGSDGDIDNPKRDDTALEFDGEPVELQAPPDGADDGTAVQLPN